FEEVRGGKAFSVSQSGEDQPVLVNITTHITPGADGVDLADVTHSAPSGTGTLGYNGATGVFPYTPGAGETGDVTFTYTITDGDGDHITKTVTIHLGSDSVPQAGTIANAAVDDAGLA